jgi:DNA-binding beta-propeller fold protein YncE
MKLAIGLVPVTLLVLLGCGAGDASSLEGSSDALDAVDALTDPESATACPRPVPAADRTRKVVVGHSFGDNPNRYEVLDLGRTGRLTKTGVTFEMGRAADRPIVFTRDGKIGLVAQDGGTIGVFRFDAEGRPEVVHAGFKGGFYGHAVAVDPSGTRAYVVDRNTTAHGGGVYELAIGCDGTLTSRGLVVPGGNADALTFLPNGRPRAVLHAAKAFDSAAKNDTFLVDLNSRPSLVAQGDGFGDQAAIASSIAVTQDGKYALVADDSLSAGNRIAVVTLPTMKQRQILKTTVPYALVTSPFDNAALVVNGDSADEITTIRYDRANDVEPFTIAGPLAYTMPRPQLPGAAVQIMRGTLKGRVLVAELMAVRQVQFARDGSVADVAQTTWEKTMDNIVGTVGVQP